MQAFWWVYFGVIMMAFVVGLFCFEVLIWKCRKRYPEEWSKYYWFSVRFRFANDMLFRTPNWIRHDRQCRVFHKIHRICSIIVLGGIGGFLALALLLS